MEGCININNNSYYQQSSTVNYIQRSTLFNFHSMAAASTSSSTVSSSWTHKKLVRTVINDEPTLLHWLRARNLLASDMSCTKCGSQCRQVRRRGSYSWRCPTKGCQAYKSIREGSFFTRSHLGLDVIVELMYFWSKQVRSLVCLQVTRTMILLTCSPR